MTTIAFAGAGHITAVHALAAQAIPGVDITAIASRTPGRAAERAEQVGTRACAYDELPGGADVVFVTTPPSAHAIEVIRALQGGAAAIVEKPLATTLADADRIVDAAAAAGGRVGYAENLAYAPIIEQALAGRPALGTIHHLELRVLQPPPDWGEFLTAGYGGGVLFDVGAHPVALTLLFAHPARPVEVSAHLERRTHGEVDDHAEVTISFDSGLHARVHVSWRTEDTRIWDLQAASASGVLRVELLPQPGIEADGEPVPVPAAHLGLPAPGLEEMGYAGQLTEMLGDFAAGREPVMSVAFGREVLEVLAAAYASAGDGGRPEALPFTGRRDRTPLELWLE